MRTVHIGIVVNLVILLDLVVYVHIAAHLVVITLRVLLGISSHCVVLFGLGLPGAASTVLDGRLMAQVLVVPSVALIL